MGHAASAEIRDRSMHAIQAKFAGAPWYDTMMGGSLDELHSRGGVMTNTPSIFANDLQDDLVTFIAWWGALFRAR